MYRTVIISLIIIGVAFSAQAMEKTKLYDFLKAYDASQEKANKWGKIAYAVEIDRPDIAIFLVRNGESAAVSYPMMPHSSLEFWTKHPLMTAITKGYKDLAIAIVQSGIPLQNNSACEIKGHRRQEHREIKHPIHAAIEQCNGGVEIVAALLDAGVNIELPDQYLVRGKPYPTLSPTHGCTSLYIAIATKQLDIAQLLIIRGANIECQGNDCIAERNWTPLMKAADDGYLEGVAFLLNNGAEILHNVGGISALDLAVRKGYYDIADLLYEYLDR